MGHHVYSLLHALGRLRSAPMSWLLNALVIGIALALPLGGYLLVSAAQDVLARTGTKAEVSLFLAREATSEEIEQVGRRLRQTSGVATVRFVPKDRALAELKRSAGLGEVAETLSENPLPDAFIATLASQDPALADSVAAAARSWDKVAHAQADAAWLRRLQSLLRAAETGVWLLGAILALGLVAIVFNTIRLQVLTQRDEIEVSRMVGATDAFIRRPFLYSGGLQGLLGGLIAWLLVFSALQLLQPDVAAIGALYGSALALRFPEPAEIGVLLVTACFVGWAGALLSVSKHLQETP